MQSHIQKPIEDRTDPTKIYYWWAHYWAWNGTDNAPDKSKPVWQISLVELDGKIQEAKRPLDSKWKASNSYWFIRDDRTSLTFI